MGPKRKMIMLDCPPDPFFQNKKPKTNNTVEPVSYFEKITCDDTSPTLLVDKWKTPWFYRDYHVRVTSSTNSEIQEGTTFVSSIHAANMMGCGGYHNIHNAIKKDKSIKNCFLEYTSNKK